MESFFGTVTAPSSALSSPAIIRKSVVLPAPFGPTSPAFSPGLSWKEASTKMTWRPYCLLTEAKEIIEGGANSARGADIRSPSAVGHWPVQTFKLERRTSSSPGHLSAYTCPSGQRTDTHR